MSDIQPGGPGTAVTCERCGHVTEDFAGDARKQSIACTACDAHYDYGERRVFRDVVVVPDRHFVHVVLDDGTRVPVCKEQARMFGMALLRLASG